MDITKHHKLICNYKIPIELSAIKLAFEFPPKTIYVFFMFQARFHFSPPHLEKELLPFFLFS